MTFVAAEGYDMQTRAKGFIAVGVIAVSAVLAVSWWFNRDTPDAVSIDQALEAVEADDSTPIVLDGTWAVSATAESFAGVRIDEELRGVGSITAVLRTPDVTGDATLANGMLQALTLTVDLTTLASDDPRRDRALPATLDLANFPVATFTLTDPVDVAGLANGPVTFEASGTLTVKGVTRPVTATVTADTTVGAIVAVAQLPITFAEFDVRLPSAPIVLSINETGTLEAQLRFIPG